MSRQPCSQPSDMPKSPQLNVDIRWLSQIAPWNTNRNIGNIFDISPALHVYLLGMVWRDSQIQDRSLYVFNHWSAGQFVLDIITSPAHQCAWWRHQMEIFSASLALCAGNSPVSREFPKKGQWRGALMFSLICAWMNGWVNNCEAGELKHHRVNYDVIVTGIIFWAYQVLWNTPKPWCFENDLKIWPIYHSSHCHVCRLLQYLLRIRQTVHAFSAPIDFTNTFRVALPAGAVIWLAQCQ